MGGRPQPRVCGCASSGDALVNAEDVRDWTFDDTVLAAIKVCILPWRSEPPFKFVSIRFFVDI